MSRETIEFLNNWDAEIAFWEEYAEQFNIDQSFEEIY